MPSQTFTADAAGTWQLGDLTVNRIGFGTMRLTGTAAFDLGTPRDRSTSIAVLRRALELGVNHLDTAAFYFSPLRSALELVRSALAPYPDDLVIATKVGPGRDPSGEWLPWARPEQLRGQVEENLRLLGRDHLDVVNLRTFGRGPIADPVGALVELRADGLLRHIGLSNVDVAQLDEALTVTDVVCVQNRHGLDFRLPGAADVLRVCGERGIAFVPYFSIVGEGKEQGVDASAEHDVVLEVAQARGATPAQVRLAWTLAQGPHVLAIPGTGDLRHLEENVAAGALELSADDLSRLDGLSTSQG
jgi:aryl-alcohol dehydrogenase-like predicted oxidoreductase